MFTDNTVFRICTKQMKKRGNTIVKLLDMYGKRTYSAGTNHTITQYKPVPQAQQERSPWKRKTNA